MKIYKSEVESGLIRWLMRLSGWFSLMMGIAILVLGRYTDAVNDYFYEGPVKPLAIGALLVVLDLLLPDPVRARRRAKKKCEKLYQKLCKALPSNRALFDAAVSPTTRALLERQLRMQGNLGKVLFQKAPTREMLTFIHACNKNAAYEICAEIVRDAQKTAGK